MPAPAGSTGAPHSQLSGCCSRELVTLLLFLAPPDWPRVPLLYGADTLWDMDSWELASSCTFLDCQHLEGDRTQRGSSMRDSSWEGTETPGGEQQKCLKEAGKSFRSVPGSICLGVPWTTSDFLSWDDGKIHTELRPTAYCGRTFFSRCLWKGQGLVGWEGGCKKSPALLGQ